MVAGAQRAFGIASKVKLTFEEYLRQYPQGEGFFELVDGELIKMEAIRAHKNISRFLVKTFDRESERLGIIKLYCE